MTYAIDRLFEEVFQTAYKRGYKQGQIEVAQRMLQAGMEPERIAHYTDLSLEELAKLEPNG